MERNPVYECVGKMINPAGESSGMKLQLERVRLDRGGYDQHGRYFGVGEPLYQYTNDDGTTSDYFYRYVRARDRAEAKRKIREEPFMRDARFYR